MGSARALGLKQTNPIIRILKRAKRCGGGEGRHEWRGTTPPSPFHPKKKEKNGKGTKTREGINSLEPLKESWGSRYFPPAKATQKNRKYVLLPELKKQKESEPPSKEEVKMKGIKEGGKSGKETPSKEGEVKIGCDTKMKRELIYQLKRKTRGKRRSGGGKGGRVQESLCVRGRGRRVIKTKKVRKLEPRLVCRLIRWVEKEGGQALARCVRNEGGKGRGWTRGKGRQKKTTNNED